MEERARLKIKENDISKSNETEEKDTPIEPFRTNCEYCGKNIVTCVKKEYNLIIFPYAIVILYFYGLLYGLVLFAFTFLLFQNISHICPECLCEVANKSFFPLKQKGPFYSITFGKMTIVLKKIYIHLIILLVLIFGIYINIISYKKIKKDSKYLTEEYLRNDEKKISYFYNESDTELSWETLIKECGAKVIVENSARAIEIFNKKYFEKKIHWKGYFINAYINRLSQIGMADPGHLININVRMIPSESLKAQDLLLSMGKQTFYKYFESIKKMRTGTPIEFKAIFESIGTEWKPHHLHLEWIDTTEDFMKDKVNVTLFKGISFDIEGHMKLKNDLENIKDIPENKNNTVIQNKEENKNKTVTQNKEENKKNNTN